MGVPHLYSFLRPYASPAAFPVADGTLTSLFIDGPGLAYHLYGFLFSQRARSGNPWDTAVPYPVFAGFVVNYLQHLERCGFRVEKIYFDSALPASKRPTRLARLQDSLSKLVRYRNDNPTLRSSPASSSSAKQDAQPSFAAAPAPVSQPLPAPLFIVAAAIDVLRSHPRFGQPGIAESVPGEADGFLARAAAAAVAPGGVVLTGDSDLLLFQGIRVLFFRDLTLSAASTAAAEVFDPREMEAKLGYPLLDVAFEVARDHTASLGRALERLARNVARREVGAAVEAPDAAWRAEYNLPPLELAGMEPVDPRIGEVLWLARRAREGKWEVNGEGKREMFLPFLWDDSQRASAWEVGAGVRALAYRVLFGDGEDVMEVGRKGGRIVELPVNPAAADAEETWLRQSVEASEVPEGEWWIDAVLNLLCRYSLARSSAPPSKADLAAAAHMFRVSDGPAVAPGRKWTWALVHTSAQIQAGLYSLLLLRSAVGTIDAPTSPQEKLLQRLQHLPLLGEGCGGQRFLAGYLNAGEQEERMAQRALDAYWSLVHAGGEEEENIHSNESVVPPDVNGNGKREWEVSAGKKKRKKKRAKDGAETDATNSLEAGNMFAVLEMQ